MIFETIVTVRNDVAGVHIAPMGVREDQDYVVISPFRPSSTLTHILRERCAAINYTDDVRVFAGCLTGRYDWPTAPTARIDGVRLADALAHAEVVLERIEDDAQRPRLFCRGVARMNHRAFRGFNRAQAAVIEAAILVSRLDMLPREKIDSELAYLSIAMGKTAGPREREAWDWLQEHIARHREQAA